MAATHDGGDLVFDSVIGSIEPGPYFVLTFLYGLLGISVAVVVTCRAFDFHQFAPPLLFHLLPLVQ